MSAGRCDGDLTGARPGDQLALAEGSCKAQLHRARQLLRSRLLLPAG